MKYKLFLLLICGCFALFSHSQKGNDTLQVIAKFDYSYPLDNFNVASYTVLNTIYGKSEMASQIFVSYIEPHDFKQDTVLISIVRNPGIASKHSYHFPDFDPKPNIENVSFFTVDHDFLEGCETGRGDCNPQTFKRRLTGQKAFVFMPCGGTFSTIQLRRKTDQLPVQEVSVERKDCPPFFDVTNLEDGDYYASMMSCGLGGGFMLQLRTNSPKKELPEERITCRCTFFAETNPAYNWSQEYEALPEEMTQVPPISETEVNYLTNYVLESDSSGRVLKMVRTNYYEKTTETTLYIYDAQNRLIREDIHMDNAISSESNFLYREERVDFYYDEKGRRIKKVRKLLEGPDKEIVLEECFYLYQDK